MQQRCVQQQRHNGAARIARPAAARCTPRCVAWRHTSHSTVPASNLSHRICNAVPAAVLALWLALPAAPAISAALSPAHTASIAPAAAMQQPLPEAALGSTQRLAAAPARCLADVAGLFSSGDALTEERDPTSPFTMYGTNSKQYVIEQLDGNKVVARKRGFTVDTCISVIPADRESAQFQGLPTGEKVRAAGELTCRAAVGSELQPVCAASCKNACETAFEAYEEKNFRETGYHLDGRDKERMLRTCSRSCAYECTKGGRAYDFVVPSRR